MDMITAKTRTTTNAAERVDQQIESWPRAYEVFGRRLQADIREHPLHLPDDVREAYFGHLAWPTPAPPDRTREAPTQHQAQRARRAVAKRHAKTYDSLTHSREDPPLNRAG